MRGSCELLLPSPGGVGKNEAPAQTVVPNSIREREGFAPAVLADLAGDHLAGFRWLEQRAHGAAVNAIRRVPIFGLLRRHFFGASVCEIRNKNPADTPLATAPITFRRDLSNRFSTMELCPGLVVAAQGRDDANGVTLRSNFQTAKDTTPRSRGAPELCVNLPPNKTEGAGNAGRSMRPQPRV
jgi:hypothetical protein